MTEVDASILNDENHWQVQLKGLINGTETTRSYHLHGVTKTAARMGALLKFGGDFDNLPWVAGLERYRNWRAWEQRPEGQCGM